VWSFLRRDRKNYTHSTHVCSTSVLSKCDSSGKSKRVKHLTPTLGSFLNLFLGSSFLLSGWNYHTRYQALTCDRPWSWPMNTTTGARPKHGSLYFLDYTDEQIEAMNLPAWQKPVVVAMSHYGGYVGDTGGHQYDGTQPSRIEGAEAYATAGIECPIFKWLEGQGVPHHIDSGSTVYTGGWFEHLGSHTGVNCPDNPCGVLEHVHIADECVPLGMAGLPGGCAQ
jgi:hypothetical protein